MRYAPPKEYYGRSKNKVANNPLKQALSQYVDETLPKIALDLGCGDGYETQYLLDHGWSVTAVDGNADAAKFILKLSPQEKVNFIRSDFEDFAFGNYSLINSSFALPFAHRDKFNGIFSRLVDSIESGGLFVGNLFGVNDQWNNPGETMTFLDFNQVQQLLKDFDVILLDDNEKDGTIANGKPKHWHTFGIIARKK